MNEKNITSKKVERERGREREREGISETKIEGEKRAAKEEEISTILLTNYLV